MATDELTALQEAMESTLAQFLIELAFTVPKGTDLRPGINPKLTAFTDALVALRTADLRADRDRLREEHKQRDEEDEAQQKDIALVLGNYESDLAKLREVIAAKDAEIQRLKDEAAHHVALQIKLMEVR
jgi:hypothetical protein